MNRPYLIGIAGPSGAGKSALARELAATLAAPVVSLDRYYRDLPHLPFEQRANVNFDEPAALEHELLISQMRTLSEGAAIQAPVYDFARHLRAAQVERFEAARYIIVEGLFALYWEDLRALLGTKVFVELPDEVCLARRLERDIRDRGRSAESVIGQYAATVRPMALLHVLPTRQFADVVASGSAPLEASVRSVREHIGSVSGAN